MRWVGIDWSGRVDPRAHLWVAEHDGEAVVDLRSGRTRDEVVGHLIALLDRDPELVVGLDFSFALPAWFGHDRGPALWERAQREVEGWLADCAWPFWGRPGKTRPPGVEQYRATEHHLRAKGFPAKSTFQIGGAGSVGTASLRGWPALRALRAAGFAIWPFDAARLPIVMEVYPRACTGPVVKCRRGAREAWLAARHLPMTAAVSEDAFDAFATVVALADAALPSSPAHPLAPCEGWVWLPR